MPIEQRGVKIAGEIPMIVLYRPGSDEIVAIASMWTSAWSEAGAGRALVIWADPEATGLGDLAPAGIFTDNPDLARFVWNNFYNDYAKRLGFEEAAEYYYFPGWHQQATFFDLYVHLDQWNKLTDQHKAIIDVACGDMIRAMIARGEAAQWEVLKSLQRRGIQLKRWPAEVLVALENNWYQVVREESAANPNFARVYKSYADFRANYDIWRYLSYLD